MVFDGQWRSGKFKKLRDVASGLPLTFPLIINRQSIKIHAQQYTKLKYVLCLRINLTSVHREYQYNRYCCVEEITQSIRSIYSAIPINNMISQASIHIITKYEVYLCIYMHIVQALTYIPTYLPPIWPYTENGNCSRIYGPFINGIYN